MKRAQIFVSDLVGSFRGRDLGNLDGLERLTCFADYKLPQLFHNDGVFAYAPALEAAVRDGQEIAADSPEEVSIRAATIVTVERLKAELAVRGRALTSRELDWMLWEEAVKPGRLAVPHHRTVTTSY